MKYIRKRYVLIFTELEKVPIQELLMMIKARVEHLFGVLIAQSMDIKLFCLRPHFLILRCDHRFVNDSLFALNTIKIDNTTLLPLRVSGTIRKLKNILEDFASNISSFGL